MEKTIKLTMNKDKSIKIAVNNEDKHVINAQDRSIDAENIYKIINFSVDDSYVIQSENIENIDDKVLSFFVDLFKEIVEKLNKLTEQNVEEETIIDNELDT